MVADKNETVYQFRLLSIQFIFRKKYTFFSIMSHDFVYQSRKADFLTAIRAVLQTAFFFLPNLLFCQGVIFHPFSTFDISGCVRTCQDTLKHVDVCHDK